MSEPIVKPEFDNTPPQEELDALSLAALISSRLCHDLINPVGALGSGLEVLEDPSMDDGMRDAALDLVKTGGEKSVALLKYARLAYGASGGRGTELPWEEAGQILDDVFKWVKPALAWNIPSGYAPKNHVKTVMILTHFAADFIPRGGTVSVTTTGASYRIESEGRRALLQEDLQSALAGHFEELKPKFTPAYIAGMLSRASGGQIGLVRENEEKIVTTVDF